MRIAVGGIHLECSSYNPVPTAMEAFRILRGEVLLRSDAFGFLSDYPAEFLPTLHARAIPGGPVEPAVYVSLRDEFLDRLRALGPVDGLYLAMHGAMFVAGMEDAEGDWITRARAVVGDGCPISVSYDLHGNVSQRIVDAIDMFSTYRTAPHIDAEETQRRSVAMLLRCLQGGERPCVAWTPIPVVLPGERTSTVDQPAKDLYAALPGIDGRDGIWDASLMVGYVWADEPRATAAAIMTGTVPDRLRAASAALAQRYWAARRMFAFGSEVGDIAGCVARALSQAGPGPAILADSGDNPTGGGVGDRADVLAELLAQGVAEQKDSGLVIVAAITDAPATALASAAGIGATVSLRVGASLDRNGSQPVAVTGTVMALHPAGTHPEQEAVIAIGPIRLVLAARRRPYHRLADFARLGLDPLDARLLVVKSGYLSPELAPIASPSLMALSPGVVDQHVERLPRRRKAHPTYPFDKDFDWAPEPVLSIRAAVWAANASRSR